MPVLQSCHADMSAWILFVAWATKPGSALIVSGLPLILPDRSTGVETYMHNV